VAAKHQTQSIAPYRERGGMTGFVRIAVCIMFVLLASSCLAQQGIDLPPVQVQETPNVEILLNGGFEESEPITWKFTDWPPRPDTGAALIADSIFRTQDVAHSGQWALGLDLTTVEEDRILLCQQAFGADKLAAYDGRLARMSAWVILGRGPAGYQGQMSMRHWGPPGAPPIGSRRIYLSGSVDEWNYCSEEFILRVGETTRADMTVSASQVPELRDSPVVYVDDVSLAILGEADLQARLTCGTVLFEPDDLVPVRVDVSEEAWEAGKRQLRWNIASPDGLTGYAEGDVALTARTEIVELALPDLPDGEYSARLALGAEPGERAAEVLLPLRRVAGPFAK